MAGCTTAIRIEAPPERVFAAISDFENAPKRISGIKRVELLTKGPPGVGTKFRETRMMFGREATETMEVTRFDPGRSYELTAISCGSLFRSLLSVAPAGSGASEVTMTLEVTPKTLFAKIMGFFMKRMLKLCEKAVRSDLEQMKTSLEASSP